MGKVLRCGDVMPGCSCDAEVQGKDVAEVMAKAEEHAKTAHGVTMMRPDAVAKARAAIKER